MKTQSLAIATLIGSVLFSNAAMAGGRPSSTDSNTTELSDAEVSTLQFMREEEKLARDVYLTLDQSWGYQTDVFANIALSEEEHTTSISYLLDKYGVEDPVVHDEIGVFTDPDLQALYNQLVEQGWQSLVDALYVGALIEEVDMEDIVSAIEETDERTIIRVYANLLDGSENHLRAFVGVIEEQGIVYEAQVLDADEVAHILESESDSDHD